MVKIDKKINKSGNGFIPVIGLTPILSLSEKEHTRVVNTMKNLSGKLSKAMGTVFEVVDCDLIENQDGCTNPTGMHEVAKYKNPKTNRVQLLCIHCLKGFSVATEFKGAFFIPTKEQEEKIKPAK